MKPTFLLVPVAALVAAFAAAEAVSAAGVRLTKFDAGTLRPVVAGAGRMKTTSYVLDYTITNETAAGRKPGLRLEVRTKDTNRTHGDAYDAAAFAAVARDTHAQTELVSTARLRTQEQAAGAKAAGLANFGAVDPNSDHFQVRVYGLYDPVFRDRNNKVWSENRVLVLNYERSGDEFDRVMDPIRLVSTVVETEGDVKAVHPSK